METFEPDNRKPTREEKNSSIFAPSLFNNFTPLWKKLLFFFTGYIGLQLIAVIVQLILITTPLFDKTSQTLSLLGSVLINFLSYLVLTIILLILLCTGREQLHKTLFRSFKKKSTYIWGFIGFGAILVVNMIFSQIERLIPDSGSNANQSNIEAMMNSYPLLVVFMTAIMAPFCEELTYRAGLNDAIGKKNRWLGILLSALVFGLIHFDFSPILHLLSPEKGYYTDAGTAKVFIEYTAEELAKLKDGYLHALYNELINFPIYYLSGAILAFVYCYTGDLSTSMFAHFLVNSFSALSFFFAKGAGNGSSENLLRLFLK